MESPKIRLIELKLFGHIDKEEEKEKKTESNHWHSKCQTHIFQDGILNLDGSLWYVVRATWGAQISIYIYSKMLLFYCDFMISWLW